MRYVAAYLLLVLSGNESPSAADIKKVLAAGSVDADDSRIEKLIGELKGKDVEEVIKAGKSKLAAVPSAPVAASAGAATGGAVPAAKAEEKPKEEEKPESEDMGFDLFG